MPVGGMSASSLDERPDLFPGGLGICIQDNISDNYYSDLLQVLDCRFGSEMLSKLVEWDFGDSSLTSAQNRQHKLTLTPDPSAACRPSKVSSHSFCTFSSPIEVAQARYLSSISFCCLVRSTRAYLNFGRTFLWLSLSDWCAYGGRKEGLGSCGID